ncbi:hypothetical protein, partial [Vibrio atypicus]|uniref:hypothetical protein n=1 Tax=Vibrio atypicus TaxID=558271 RepID=UPI003FCD19AC
MPLALFTLISSSLSLSVLAQEAEKEVQDMSDPLAVYTQAGLGVTNKGINIKVGQTYDTGSETTMGMNILEIKGLGGESLGWADENHRNDSVDSIRFRNFGVDLTNGRGSQVDVNWDFNSGAGSASYSLIQALPKMGPVQFYPLAGLGLAISESAEEGYQVPGSFGVMGVYTKLTITDKIWFNYNPMYMVGLGGKEEYKNTSVLAHEIALSYQINPRSNVRTFVNFTNKSDVKDFATLN